MSRMFISLLSADFICMLFFRFRIYPKTKTSISTGREPHNKPPHIRRVNICEENIRKKDIRKENIHKENIRGLNIREEKKETSAAAVSVGGILDVSIMNGFETITRLGGYILLFSVLAGCVRYYWPFPLFYQYLLLGFTEITTGLSLIATSGLPGRFCAVLSVTAVASGGFCILAQTKKHPESGTQSAALPGFQIYQRRTRRDDILSSLRDRLINHRHHLLWLHRHDRSL